VGDPRAATLWGSPDADAAEKNRQFDAYAFLESAGLAKRVVMYRRRDVIFSQGDRCDTVMYVRSGGIPVSVLSRRSERHGLA
jgi:CRP-like cAMP-binding protein